MIGLKYTRAIKRNPYFNTNGILKVITIKWSVIYEINNFEKEHLFIETRTGGFKLDNKRKPGEGYLPPVLGHSNSFSWPSRIEFGGGVVQGMKDRLGQALSERFASDIFRIACHQQNQARNYESVSEKKLVRHRIMLKKMDGKPDASEIGVSENHV